MRKNHLPAIIATLTILIALSCSNKRSLVGKWKMIQLSSIMPGMKDTFHLDITDSAAMNKVLRDRLPAIAWNDPAIFGQQCYLQLNRDSTLRMYDIGIFTLGVGNYLGAEYGGTWGIESDSLLRLEFYKGKQKIAPLYFTIQQYTPDSLALVSMRAGAFYHYQQVNMARE